MSIKIDNIYFRDDEGKLHKIAEIGDVVITNRQDNSVVQVISGEMLFGDKGRIECTVEDDKQVIFIIDGKEKKIVVEKI